MPQESLLQNAWVVARRFQQSQTRSADLTDLDVDSGRIPAHYHLKVAEQRLRSAWLGGQVVSVRLSYKRYASHMVCRRPGDIRGCDASKRDP